MICLKLFLEVEIYRGVRLEQLVVLPLCLFVVLVHMQVIKGDPDHQVGEFFHLEDVFFEPLWWHSLNNLFILMIGDVIQRWPMVY